MCHQRHFDKSTRINLNEMLINLNEILILILFWLLQHPQIIKAKIFNDNNFNFKMVKKCTEQLHHIESIKSIRYWRLKLAT